MARVIHTHNPGNQATATPLQPPRSTPKAVPPPPPAAHALFFMDTTSLLEEPRPDWSDRLRRSAGLAREPVDFARRIEGRIMVPAALPQSQSTNPTDGASVVVTFTNAGANTTQAGALSVQDVTCWRCWGTRRRRTTHSQHEYFCGFLCVLLQMDPFVRAAVLERLLRHARDLSPRCTRHNAATRGLGPHTRQAGDLTGQETNSCAGMGCWW